MNRREAQDLTQNIPFTSDDDDEENSNMVSHQYKKYNEFEKNDFLNNNNSEDPQSPTHGNNNKPEKFKMIHLGGADGNDLNPVVIPGNSNNTTSEPVIPDDSATNMATDSESMVQNSEQSVVPVQGNEESEQPSTEQIEVPGPASPESGQWANPWEFVLSCIALSVGLGNVWRFPFIAYRNGGGAFLIPYFLVVLFIGRRIFFLELRLGQFSSLSSVQVWRIKQFYAGVGLGSMIATLLVLSYYITNMALTLFYFCASFQTNLPWDTWNKEWKMSNTNEIYKCIYDENTKNDILDPQYKYTRSAPQLYKENPFTNFLAGLTILCGCTFLVGIMYMTRGGKFILNLVHFYGGSFVIFITSGVEVVVEAYFHSADNVVRDVEFMMGQSRLGLFSRICWLYITPFGLVGISIYYFAVAYEILTYNYVGYPVATFFVRLMFVNGIVSLTGRPIYAVYKSKKLTLKEKIIDVLTASPDWVPYDPPYRKDWIEFKHERGRCLS